MRIPVPIYLHMKKASGDTGAEKETPDIRAYTS